MSFCFLLQILRSRKLVPVSLPAGTHKFTVPAGVTKIESITGRGGEGYPATEGPDGYMRRTTYKEFRADNTQIGSTKTTYEFFEGPTPSDYCQGFMGSGTSYHHSETCYYHTYMDGDTNATFGPDTTAFGKTFPGGYGGPASSASFTQVPVNPGQEYTLVVASGGSLSFNYFK